MDKETLVNHIKSVSKSKFDTICRLIITNGFNKRAINVDGKGDGGADFIELDEDGQRNSIVYQLTTQKLEVFSKYQKDVEKAVRNLKAKRFYFMCSQPVSETKTREFEEEADDALNIRCNCYDAKAIAEFLIEYKLVKRFLDEAEINYSDWAPSDELSYREQVLHTYTFLSNDAKNLKEGIYDDTIMMILGEDDGCSLSTSDVIASVKKQLSLTDVTDSFIERRLSALSMKKKVILIDGKYTLSAESFEEIECRKKLYADALSSTAAAQMNLLRDSFNIDWTIDDAKKASTILSAIFIGAQLQHLREMRAEYVSHPIFKIDVSSERNKLRKLLKSKGIEKDDENNVINELYKISSSDPLISKITRATMYVALEGASPLQKAKSLGVSNWGELRVLLEPTIAIPCICYSLFNWDENAWFAKPVKAVKKCQELGANTSIPYFYIDECAGHLLSALAYVGYEGDPEELQHSNNAFVSYYYGLKCIGAKVPNTLMEYLVKFSSQLSLEQDRKTWKRALMTDIQSLLSKDNIVFESTKSYKSESCPVYNQYKAIVNKKDPERKKYLENHDTWALQHVSDKTAEGEHWVIMTYDKTLIEYGKSDSCNFWVANTGMMQGLIEGTQSLSESNFENLVHFLATSSESTLSIGARMIDNLMRYVGSDYVNWQFKEEFNLYKKEALGGLDLQPNSDIDKIADKLVSDFFKKEGIEMAVIEDDADEN